MNTFIKKNINIIIGIFILLGPIIDLLTGLCLHTFNLNLTFGIVIRVLFLLFICLTVIFVFKKKKLIIPYLIIGLYFIFYILGIIIYKDGVGLFKEIQGLIKVFYFPILFLSLYSIKEEIKISKLTLFTVLFLYLIFIFVPITLHIGYKSYEITKSGTLGFFNSANEISGIISLLTPIMFIVLVSSKNIIPKIILSIMYLIVILTIGTKTPLLTLGLTIIFSLIYLWIKLIKDKKYKSIIASILVIIVGVIGLIIIIPKTNFYKNIEVHLDYLKLDNITEVFKDEKLVDHFIFSSRLSFLNKKSKLYNKSSFYQKLFGIGYLKKGKATKMIEMDYFDIFYSHGILGTIVFFTITIYIVTKVIKKEEKLKYEKYMLYISLLFIIFLSFFTGHIITAPSVSILSIILILSLDKKKKKDLLFASYSMDIGGIEKALLNLVNRIDTKKYNVTIVLEKKSGIFLDKINKEITVKELKVSTNDNIFLRKITNATRKLIFKIFNYQNYDFSCCYATYSYSSSKIALMSSENTAFYVHNDYRTIYKNENEFRNFFDTRNITKYKNIIFVSNENKDGFIEIYNELKEKCRVFNNFIEIEEIKRQSNEKIDVKRNPKNILFMYVGRLDDDAKKISRQINLIKEIPNIDLWIVGDGPDREKYEKEVKEYKLTNRITFFGKQKNPFKYMKHADYIILTSDYEGFPVTYLEAIALEKSIITTFPTSDDSIDINKYGYVISKEKDKMIKQVKDIIKKETNKQNINLEKVQIERMKKLEELFNN